MIARVGDEEEEFSSGNFEQLLRPPNSSATNPLDATANDEPLFRESYIVSSSGRPADESLTVLTVLYVWYFVVDTVFPFEAGRIRGYRDNSRGNRIRFLLLCCISVVVLFRS